MEKLTPAPSQVKIVAKSQRCSKCWNELFVSHLVFGNTLFYCDQCQIYTPWNWNTKLAKCQLQLTQIEKLIAIFLSNKTPKDAFDVLNFSFVNDSININTIRRYFTVFCNVLLDYYQREMNYVLLENEVEIDESHVFREKKSKAPHRRYKNSSIWIFGIKQRNSSKFILVQLKDRREETLISIIRKHVKIGSTIYSDSFSVYVNNKQKESKLQR